jgi:ribosomal-protein-alanine N-acetyltransferase
MAEFTVRRARESDIPEVMRINVETLPENYWYGFYKHLLDNWGEAFLVAEQADPVLLGLTVELEEEGSFLKRIVSMLKSLTEPRPLGHLVSIAVREQYRRMGVGSRLLGGTIRAMMDVYKTDSIYLEVRISNAPAIRLYEKYGFRKARIIKGYYSDGEDAYVMVKRIK